MTQLLEPLMMEVETIPVMCVFISTIITSWSLEQTLMGPQAAGDGDIDFFVFYGSRVAIGAEGNNGAGTDSGHVRIYDYNGRLGCQV